jgi:hypothetical protein
LGQEDYAKKKEDPSKRHHSKFISEIILREMNG